MKCREAIKLLEEGKKVRGVDWHKDFYIVINENGYIVDKDGCSVSDVEKIATHWEEYIDKQDIEEIKTINIITNDEESSLVKICDKLNEIIRVVNSINKRLEK